MPDNVYFRQPATQNMMLDILFVWCKMHPAIGYRQGMHEILAPLLWVVERDAIELKGASVGSVDDTLADVMDANYIEHDTHMLFAIIMQTAKSYYAPADSGSTTKDTPMLARSSKIFEHYLPKVDAELHAHLVKLDIVPQIFLLRWIRLLFGREFALDDVFDMWDALFAIDSTLELVDMIAISMLLRIRWKLLAADTNEAFTLLLKYPEPATPAYTFIKDALYLRDHLDAQGGTEIITRYGQPPPAKRLEPAPSFREPSPSPFSSHRARNSLGSPRSFVGQQGAGIEALFQGAAKNVLERGSQWGVGKALRDAVGEVRKNVEAYQSGTNSGQSTPRSGGREFRRPAQFGAANTRPGPDRAYSVNASKKIEELDRRNGSLAKMLEAAVADLWEYHKERNEDQKVKKADDKSKESLEALSLAIAKVQFVQVYLEDSSIPLPVEEVTEQAATAKAVATLSSSEVQSPAPSENVPAVQPITVTSTAEAVPKDLISTKSSIAADSQSMSPTKAQPRSPLNVNLSPRSRPHLTSSSFSWMLGEESASSDFATGAAHSTFSADEKRRMKGKGFLFGEDDDDEGSIKDGKRGSISSKSSSKGGKSAKSKHASDHAEVEEEVIDLANMGARGVI